MNGCFMTNSSNFLPKPQHHELCLQIIRYKGVPVVDRKAKLIVLRSSGPGRQGVTAKSASALAEAQ
jgi:hypothetical protein